MDDGYVREGVGGCVRGAGSGLVCAAASEADAGDAGKSEEVRFVGVGTGTNEAGYAGCDAPVVQRGRSIVLDKGDCGQDGIGNRRVKETNECISLIVGNWECKARRGEEDKRIGKR